MFVFLRSGCFVLVFIGSFLSEGSLLDGVVSARANREMLSAKHLLPLENLPLTKAVLEGNGHYFLQQWRLLDSQEKRTVLDLKTARGESLLHLLAEEGRKASAIGTMTFEIINEIVAEKGLYKNRPDKGLEVLYAENFSGKTVFDMVTEPLKKALSKGEQALFLRSNHLIRKQALFAAAAAAGATAMAGIAAFKISLVMGGGAEEHIPLLLSAGGAISVVSLIQCQKAFKTLRSLKQSVQKQL